MSLIGGLITTAIAVSLVVTAVGLSLFYLPGDIRDWRNRREMRRARRIENEGGEYDEV